MTHSRIGDIERSDDALLEGLRAGDEHVFNELVQGWGRVMLRLASAHVANRAIAEEVVQDAWLTVLRSLTRFERRSSFRTWVLGIVINIARARARAERQSAALDADKTTVPGSRFLPADHPRWPHHWAISPKAWPTPEDALLAEEVRRVILDAVHALPAAQREVLILRDLEGVLAAEVCNILQVSDTNQRVLLHRARSRVRHALERYFAAKETP